MLSLYGGSFPSPESTRDRRTERCSLFYSRVNTDIDCASNIRACISRGYTRRWRRFIGRYPRSFVIILRGFEKWNVEAPHGIQARAVSVKRESEEEAARNRGILWRAVRFFHFEWIVSVACVRLVCLLAFLSFVSLLISFAFTLVVVEGGD